MKTKILKLCSLLMALLTITSLLTACGDSGADEPESTISQQESNGADVDESVELDFWLGEYASDSGTLTIDNTGGMLCYAMGYNGEDGAVLYLILSVVGLGFIGWILMQNTINSMISD